MPTAFHVLSPILEIPERINFLTTEIENNIVRTQLFVVKELGQSIVNRGETLQQC